MFLIPKRLNFDEVLFTFSTCFMWNVKKKKQERELIIQSIMRVSALLFTYTSITALSMLGSCPSTYERYTWPHAYLGKNFWNIKSSLDPYLVMSWAVARVEEFRLLSRACVGAHSCEQINFPAVKNKGTKLKTRNFNTQSLTTRRQKCCQLTSKAVDFSFCRL